MDAFTPSFLEEHVYDFIKKNSSNCSPYMTMAYDTHPKVHEHLAAVIHPRDKTARPQFVSKIQNHLFYDEIFQFFKLSNIPALLNTSFNLHGEPLVETIDQAMDVMNRCDIDALITNKIIFTRV